MFRKCVAIALGCALSLAAFGTSASAATLAGDGCKGNEASLNSTLVSVRSPFGSPLPDAIPTAGVITNWSIDVVAFETQGAEYAEQLKVFRPTGAPGQFQVVGESTRVRLDEGGGVTSTPTRIPVQSGDLLGNSVLASLGTLSVTGAFFCITENAGDEAAFVEGDPVTGAIVAAAKTKAGTQNPITVTVEPDADGDGYGDETQDQCPTDASTQGPCPAPASPTGSGSSASTSSPITLSGSAVAKGGLITVSLTASAQANVTVAGSVALGHGQTTKVAGGTQTVVPGALARFTIALPAKVKAALAHLPRGRKLSVSLTASAPGAASTNLAAKLEGRKAKAHRRGRGTH